MTVLAKVRKARYPKSPKELSKAIQENPRFPLKS